MRTVSRHSTFFDVLETLAKPGCVVCTLVARTRWRYLDALAYENVNDYGLRVKLRESLGFCSRHAWYFVETTREVFGAAIIYRDVLHAIQRAAAAGNVGGLDPNGPCPACLAEWEAASSFLQVLVDALDEPDMGAAYGQSDGLCGPHLLSAVRLGRPTLAQKLLDRTLAIWRQRADDDLARTRWRATGAEGNFSMDGAALGAPSAPLPAVPHLTVSDAFTCPICATSRAVLADPEIWQSLGDADGGICNVHAGLPGARALDSRLPSQVASIEKRASALVVSSEGRGWLREAMRELARPPEHLDPGPLPFQCVACRHVGALEATMAADTEIKPLCLPHLRRAISVRGPSAIEPMKPTWRELDHLLGEYLRKEDYRFHGEPRGLEQMSPRWAVSLISGAPGVR